MSAPIPKRSNTRTIVILSVVGVAIVGIWIVWSLSMFGQGPSALQTELRLAKADGLPLSAEDVRKSRVVPTTENAAPLLRTAFTERQSSDQTVEGKAIGKFVGRNSSLPELTAEQIAQVEPWIRKQGHLFELLGRAVSRPSLDFDRKWELGPALLLPEFADEKACLTHLLLKAKVEMSHGNTAAAMDTLEVGSKLSRLVGQEPLIIGALVQVAMRSSICEALTEIIKAHQADALVLKRSRQIIDEMGPMPDVRHAIQSEFLMGRVAISMLASADSVQLLGGDGGNTVFRLARIGPVRTIYDLRFTQLYRTLYKDLCQNPSSVLSMEQAFKRAQAFMEQKGSKDWTYGLADVLSPVFVGMAGAVGESEARRNVIRTAITQLDCKRMYGTWSQKMVITPHCDIDPFTNKALLFKPAANGFTIYSVGKDEQDDGGKPRPKKYSGGNYDIVFSIP